MNHPAHYLESADRATELRCYHCDESIAAFGTFSSIRGREKRHFCCAGCQAITEMIEGNGFASYYSRRDAPGAKPAEDDRDFYDTYDHPAMQQGWCKTKGYIKTADLLVDNISCAACVWLIENWLLRQPAIHSASVHLSNFRLTVSWDSKQLKLSDIFRLLQQIGYRSRPFNQIAQQSMLEKQSRDLLKRLGVAAAFGMQIMVISVALYTGDWFGMDSKIKIFLERANLLLCLPILFYSSKPFFSKAIGALRIRKPGMDIPVSLGLTLAFLGSIWAVLQSSGQNPGDTYFDSIAMFVFFLLGARYLEASARVKGGTAIHQLTDNAPRVAQLLKENQIQSVPVHELVIGDVVCIPAGQKVPADGVIILGDSSFDESLLTGEHLPITKETGDKVLAGSINIEQVCQVQVTAMAKHSTLSSITELADMAAREKSRISEIVEKVAVWFICGVLVTSVAVALYGFLSGSSDWLAITIATLVVTCPCALSLATPLSMTAATNHLMQKGVYVINQSGLEILQRISMAIFDKTGTLTDDSLKLAKVEIFGDIDKQTCLALACAMERTSNHPLASAFAEADLNRHLTATEVRLIPGHGLEGIVEGKKLYLGSLKLIDQLAPGATQSNQYKTIKEQLTHNQNPAIVLADNKNILALFLFKDQLRSGVEGLISYLNTQQVQSMILSGDRSLSVASIANRLGIDRYVAECLPEQKLDHVSELANRGEVIAMIGDGINDTPALGKAHLAIALSKDVNLAAANADILLTGSNLDSLIDAHKTAGKTMRIIKQNMIWAIGYNVCAIPAAVLGYVPPWLAGIGMALSSIIVVLNASRLNHATPLQRHSRLNA